MHPEHHAFLFLGALGSATAALLHLGCIAFGAPWYRFAGAGERLARLAEAGSGAPTRITSGLVLILSIWTYCALAGAGLVRQPPLLRYLLSGITLIYFARAFAVFVLMKMMPGRSLQFWWWSSAICMTLGMLHLAGTVQSWASLSMTAALDPAVFRGTSPSLARAAIDHGALDWPTAAVASKACIYSAGTTMPLPIPGMPATMIQPAMQPATTAAIGEFPCRRWPVTTLRTRGRPTGDLLQPLVSESWCEMIFFSKRI